MPEPPGPGGPGTTGAEGESRMSRCPGEAEGHPGFRMARAHPAARDRPSVWRALCRPHAQRESLFARQLHPALEREIHSRNQAIAVLTRPALWTMIAREVTMGQIFPTLG